MTFKESMFHNHLLSTMINYWYEGKQFNVKQLPLKDLKITPPTHPLDLEEDIKQNGLQHPITVFNNVVEIGNNRCLAAQSLGYETISAFVCKDVIEARIVGEALKG